MSDGNTADRAAVVDRVFDTLLDLREQAQDNAEKATDTTFWRGRADGLTTAINLLELLRRRPL